MSKNKYYIVKQIYPIHETLMQNLTHIFLINIRHFIHNIRRRELKNRHNCIEITKMYNNFQKYGITMVLVNSN